MSDIRDSAARSRAALRPGGAPRLAAGLAAAGLAAAAYMVFEAQWVRCRQVDLPVPGLPPSWSGLTILHLSDVHAGQFCTNERSLSKVVQWAGPLAPDLVFLTGDILGDPGRSGRCLDLLAQLKPPLGKFAVTGNHEYGISKAPLARARDTAGLWNRAGITLLSDSCAVLPPRDGLEVVICGADYMGRGYGLLDDAAAGSAGAPAQAGPASAASPPGPTGAADAFHILLIHEPPDSGSSLAERFPLAFAGHTHGGQLRVPAPSGLTPLNNENREYLTGVYPWGAGLLVVSQGIGTSFLPLRLFTRPEATLWRLVYTSSENRDTADR